MALAINQASNPHLDALFQVGSVRREQAINFFVKILTNIIENPQEGKFKDLNHQKISGKFAKWNVNEPMIELLKQAGFEQVQCSEKGQRLRLNNDTSKCEQVLNDLYTKQQLEQERLEKERQKIIEANNKRLNNAANLKKRAMKNKILAQHNEQMKLAKQGIYNVGSSVSDRKGTGNGVNSLSY
mmetsp:Transcript_9809/g.8825  ORF Transcript_9809/g.8825 Transcript_9809/m.8825 type:complete len:184 (-) Transcript_9809:258-809(-)